MDALKTFQNIRGIKGVKNELKSREDYFLQYCGRLEETLGMSTEEIMDGFEIGSDSVECKRYDKLQASFVFRNTKYFFREWKLTNSILGGVQLFKGEVTGVADFIANDNGHQINETVTYEEVWRAIAVGLVLCASEPNGHRNDDEQDRMFGFLQSLKDNN